MKCYVITLWWLCLLGSQALAQYPNWTSFRAATQLNDAEAIGADVWMATNAGIFVATPTQQTWRHLTKVNSGLPSNEVEAIALDPTGQIWIGTYDMAMAYLQGETWIPVSFPADLLPEKPLLYCMEFDPEGSLWLGTSAGLVRYNTAGIWTLFAPNGSAQFLDQVWDIAISPAGEVYVASFFVYQVTGDEVESLSDDFFEGPIAYSHAQLVYNHTDSSLWHVNDVGQVSRYRSGDWQTWSWNDNDFPLADSYPQQLGVAPNGQMWALTQHGSSYTFDQGQWQAAGEAEADLQGRFFANEWEIVLTAETQLQLANGVLNQSLEPNNHPIYPGVTQAWAAAEGGMHFLQQGRLLHFDGQNWMADSLTHEGAFQYLLSIVANQDGPQYAIGVQYIWRRGPTSWELVGKRGEDYPAGSIYAAEVAPDGSLWMSIYENGVVHYQNGQWNIHNQGLLGHSFIPRLACAANGQVWLYYIDNTNGTVSNLARLHNGQLTVYSASELGFDPGYIYQLEAAGNGLYAASYYAGLVYFDGNTSWTSVEVPGFELAQARVTALAQHHDRLAFVVSGQGLFVQNQTNWQHFSPANSPWSGKECFGMWWSNTGELWASLNDGELLRYRDDVATSTPEVLAPALPMKLYPNPADDYMVVDLGPEHPAGHLTLFDATGRVLHQLTVVPGQKMLPLPVAGLPPGIYHLRAQFGHTTQSQTFLKQ